MVGVDYIGSQSMVKVFGFAEFLGKCPPDTFAGKVSESLSIARRAAKTDNELTKGALQRE